MRENYLKQSSSMFSLSSTNKNKQKIIQSIFLLSFLQIFCLPLGFHYLLKTYYSLTDDSQSESPIPSYNSVSFSKHLSSTCPL